MHAFHVISPATKRSVLLVLFTLSMTFFANSRAFAADIPVPQGLFPQGVTQHNAPEKYLPAFQGIPYRDDGAINASGEYTLFADQTKSFTTPGLNCSGYVLAASRFLLRKNFTLDAAMRDRLGDSGANAPRGEDWDFGWDLIMNISEGFQRTLLLPGGGTQNPTETTGLYRGYDLHTAETWKELPNRFQQGHLYLASINVESRRKGYELIHYHVGLVHVTPAGEAWFYQTTGKGNGVNRRNLKTPAGQESFKKAFANTGKSRRHMVVIDVTLP